MPSISGPSLSRRQVLLAGAATGALAGLGPVSPASAAGAGRLATAHPADTALSWMSTIYELVRKENLTPPMAARVYSLASITMFETTLAGAPKQRSLAKQLSGLTSTPLPLHRGQIDWPTALSIAVHANLEATLPFRGDTTRAFLTEALAAQLAVRTAAGVSAGSTAASRAHGLAIGRHINAWAATDGLAGIVGRPYTPPTGSEHLWESTPPNYRPAVEPYWSEIRPMILRTNDEVTPAPHVPFDPDPASAFGQQAMTTYNQFFANTDEQRAIASFWTDNPGSFTPPLGTATGLPAGHWMLLGSIGIRQAGLNLAGATELYARTGIALHEAFLNCWTWKYRLNLLRPVTYIRRYVDPNWSTFINSPQFPEYTSGHSVASPAAAAILTDLLGDFAYVDDSGAYRGVTPRTFTSFKHAAQEAAQSRLYGGIHYPMAISNGFAQGEQVGSLVLQRLKTRR